MGESLPPVSQQLLDRILRAARQISESQVDKLVEEAQQDAAAEVRTILKSSFKASFLREAARRLEGANAPILS